MGEATKGPWKVVLRHKGMTTESIRVVSADGDVVVSMPADDTMEVDDGRIVEVCSPEAKANADLLAAAPDLRDALEALVQMLFGGTVNCPNGTPLLCVPFEALTGVQAAALAALAKARGGTALRSVIEQNDAAIHGFGAALAKARGGT